MSEKPWIGIILSRGKVTKIDLEDFYEVSRHKWQLSGPHNGKFYAMKRPSCLKLHRFIMKAQDGVEIDHKSGDGLDNRKSNLRIATHSQNMANRKRPSTNKTGFKGVYFSSSNRKFNATIQVNKRTKWLGKFDDPKKAAMAYDKAARIYFGEFSRTNF